MEEDQQHNCKRVKINDDYNIEMSLNTINHEIKKNYKLPSIPEPFIKVKSELKISFSQCINNLILTMETESEIKDQVFSLARKAKNVTEKFIQDTMTGDMSENVSNIADDIIQELVTKLESTPGWVRKAFSVQDAIVSYVTCSCLEHFFAKGVLKSKKEIEIANTTEYLLGIIRFVDELENYCVGRAMWLDASSIIVCRNITKSLLNAFAEFNFRNNILRQRYDSLKYKLEKQESLIYELSVVQELNKSEVENEIQMEGLLPKAEFTDMVLEIDAETDARDKVIKGARDPQRDSKKAIFALHRGDTREARKMLDGALSVLIALAESSTLEYSELHSGAYGGALEEYVEARIFEAWLGDPGHILSFEKMKNEVHVTEQEYIGGLVDFTGEMGRLGVARATTRDIDTVKQILSTLHLVRDGMRLLSNSLSGNMSKKIEAVFINTKKMENTLYKLVLVTSANGRASEFVGISEPQQPMNEE